MIDGGPAHSDSSRRLLIDLLLGLTVLLLVGVFTQPWTAQPAPRYLLTVSIVDNHTFALDDYEQFSGVDQARFDGHLYSDKAPYQPVLAAAPYQLFRAVGGDPFPIVDGEASARSGNNVGLWWVTLWTATLPAIALAITMRRTVARIYPDVATRVAAAMALGTILLPFAGQLFGHILAALWVALSWYLVRDGAATRNQAALAGLFLGFAIGTEYPLAAIALIVLMLTLVRRQWMTATALSLGTVVGTIPLMAYNAMTFGSPFSVSYQGHLSNFEGDGALGVYNLQAPRFDELVKALVGDRGLLTLTPIILCGVVGCVIALRRRGPTRADGAVALASLGALIVLSTGIDGYGGASPGPRYLIPALPLLVLPLAEAWRRAPRICSAAAVFGGFFMLIATLTAPLLPTDHTASARTWIEWMLEGTSAANVITGSSELWITYLAAAAGLTTLVVLLKIDADARRLVRATAADPDAD